MRLPQLPLSARLAGVTVAAALMLSGCGGGGSSTPAVTAPADAGLAVLAVPTIKWDSASYTANAGDVKVFIGNNDNVKHIMVITQGDKVVGDLKLTVAKKGDTAEGTINLTPGEYFVYCIVPGHGNMKSRLTVS